MATLIAKPQDISIIKNKKPIRERKSTRTPIHVFPVANSPGEFVKLSIHDLRIDPSYQRPINERAIGRMAANWNWIACGCIIVNLRQDGLYFIIDGQHRFEAAKMRSDIIRELPCIVFQMQHIRDEACSFLSTNTERSFPNAMAKFPAMLAIHDKTSMTAQELCENIGRKIRLDSSANSFSAIGTLLRCIRENEAATRHIFTFIGDLCNGRIISGELLQSLFSTEIRLYGKTSLSDNRWRERILHIGPIVLEKSVQEVAAIEGKRTGRGRAMGIAKAINKNLRQPLLVNLS